MLGICTAMCTCGKLAMDYKIKISVPYFCGLHCPDICKASVPCILWGHEDVFLKPLPGNPPDIYQDVS